jgi:hypothetical protein
MEQGDLGGSTGDCCGVNGGASALMAGLADLAVSRIMYIFPPANLGSLVAVSV